MPPRPNRERPHSWKLDGTNTRGRAVATPVEAVLERIRAVAMDDHDKGDRFEQLMLHAFKTDRSFRQQFTEVWRWMDWPGRTGADIGIDLVARDAEGRLIAIQCKCYDPDSTLTKHDIDSFVALSGQRQWARRIIVATTDHWATNAEKSLEGHAVPIESEWASMTSTP